MEVGRAGDPLRNDRERRPGALSFPVALALRRSLPPSVPAFIHFEMEARRPIFVLSGCCLRPVRTGDGR